MDDQDIRNRLVRKMLRKRIIGIDLLLRVNAEESHHGISGPALRPVGFKTHTFQASFATTPQSQFLSGY